MIFLQKNYLEGRQKTKSEQADTV